MERSSSAPARVAGSAGTGKTIFAIHRAVRHARENRHARVLLASFSQPLADALAKKVLVLEPEAGTVVPRIVTASFCGIAEQMHQLEHGVRPRIADWLLPTVLRDTDGLEDERRGTISVFDGPAPEVKSFSDVAQEAAAVRKAVEGWLGEGLSAAEIGVFVRTSELVGRARAAVADLTGAEAMTTAPMSLAKGLEFRAVVVMACDEGVLPLDKRVADAADEAELDDIYETERRLLYVACTRAREYLMLTGVTPTSEYFGDFRQDAGC